jgi:hypothetical protein
VDEDGDCWCDLCDDLLAHDCVSEDDAYCDLCYKLLEHQCADANGDGLCDLCYEAYETVERPVGDVSGDGKLNIADTARLYAIIRGTSSLSEEEQLRYCDFNGDGKVNIVDIAKLYAHIKA